MTKIECEWVMDQSGTALKARGHEMWYQRPMRIAALQCDSGKDAHRVLDAWCEMGFNVEQLLHISAEGYSGYWREEKADEIRAYISRAKEKGLRIIFYLGMSGPKEVAENAEWRCRDSAGNRTGTLCINSPYRDWYANQVRRVAAFDIDGLFLDGPVIAKNCCYCPHCAAGYRQKYDADLPAVEDPRDKAWRDFIEFRYDSVAYFIRDARAALKSVSPAAIIYSNGLKLSEGASSARDNRRCMPYQDMLGAEGGFNFYIAPGEVPWWKAGLTARLIESQSGGKPTVIFIAGDHKVWNRYLHTPAETKLMIADTVANGANPWYGIHSPVADLQAPGGRAAAEMVRFLRDSEEYYADTESLADVAVLWSPRTADYYGRETEETDFTSEVRPAPGRTSYPSCFGGFCEMLIRLHVPFDVADQQTLLEPDLSRYKTLILPNCACLHEDELDAIRKYVHLGGNLLSSFETSLYQSDLTRRPNFGLSEVFGVDLGARVYDFRGSSYMSPACKHAAFNGVYPSVLPAPSWGAEVSATSAIPLAHFREPVDGQYRPLPPLTTPAILANDYGAGKSLYLAGNFGEHFKVYGISDHMKILGNLLRWLSPPLLNTRDLPETVEVVLRVQRKARRLLIHLVNFTGTMRRPITSVVEINDSTIEIPKSTLAAVGILEFSGILALRSGKDLAVMQTAGAVSVEVPEIHEYEVLAISAR